MDDPVIVKMRKVVALYGKSGWKYTGDRITAPTGSVFEAGLLFGRLCPVCNDQDEGIVCHDMHDDKLQKEVNEARKFRELVDSLRLYKAFGLVPSQY